MLTAVYLDLLATIVPAYSLFLLRRRKASIFGIKAGSIIRLDIYFLAAVGFDAIRNVGIDWAIYGLLSSLWLIFTAIGTLAATLYFSPESRSLRESLSKVLRHWSFKVYQTIVLTWLIVNLAWPAWYLSSTLALLAAAIAYPTGLFSLARSKAQSPRTKDMLSVLIVSWLVFVTLAIVLFALGTEPPVLGLSLPYAYETAFASTSLFFFFMTKAMTDPAGPARPWTGFLSTSPMLKPGYRYLLIHDSGEKAVSFLRSCFDNLTQIGGKIVLKTGGRDSFLEGLTRSDGQFNTWIREGKVLLSQSEPGKERVSEKRSLGPAPNIRVTELERNSLEQGILPDNRGTDQNHSSELFLLENGIAPRHQLSDFLRRNSDMQLLDLSEPKAPFSRLVNLEHSILQGKTILLEYTSDSSCDDAVDSFLTESVANAETSVFFTAKSSKLYRSIKGKRLVNIVAASSLVSVPSELPDGEVEIPDRELGLVTSIASDFLESNKANHLSFVIDSIAELIRGDRWENIYSGVKQMVELFSVPNATTLFLANRDMLELRFLGALRALFSVQMRLDKSGLQVVKLNKS